MTAEQRNELLELARRQGLIYAHQLPHTNGAKAAPPTSRWQKLLKDVAEEHIDALAPDALSVHPIDSGLDEVQREAVAKALMTTDVCLIAGPPGTGKSRVIKEIVMQAAVRGERILLIAARAAPVDRILEVVSTEESIYPLRLREATETPPPAVHRFSFAERRRILRDGTLANALNARARAEERCRAHPQEQICWPVLRKIAAELAAAKAAIADQVTRVEQVSATVREQIAAVQRESGPATNPLAEKVLHQLSQRKAIESEFAARESENRNLAEQCQRELASVGSQIERRQAILAARKDGRWWTSAWWQAGNAAAQLSELTARQQSLMAQSAELEKQLSEARQQKTAVMERMQADMDRIQQSEIEGRQAELIAQRNELERQVVRLSDRWQQTIANLQIEHCRPTAAESAAVESAFTQWQLQLRRDEQNCQFANQWAGFLQETVDNLGAKLVDLCNLVAGTCKGLEQDKQVADGVRGKLFDLLILEEAHDLTEEQFLRAASFARRCVLVGEPTWQYDLARSPRGAAVAAKSSRVFEMLWKQLHKGPHNWPFAWVSGEKSLNCRFRDVPQQQRSWLECEQVADFPEVELRILTCPNDDPVLAEVAFPPDMSIIQAKQYIFQELQELPVQPASGQCRWTEDAVIVAIRFGEDSPAGCTSIELEPGIREVVSRTKPANPREEACWRTHRIEFDKSAGWTRERANAWVVRHLPRADSPRTALLQVPHRMAPALAEFLGDALFGGAYTVPAAANRSCGVHFVPVPALRKSDQGVAELPPGGAGLELDLTTARCTDRLPPDLRTNLPTKGFVNYPEARSVVRKLEELIRQAKDDGINVGSYAVLAFYAGQVELIRGLIKRSEVLRENSTPVEVGLPGDFCHREFPVVLLSLTRSHSHRAVTFAEEFSHLALAMTRACSQLYLFGDAGTLVHRSRNNEANGRAEQHAITVLVQYLQGLGKHSQAFQLCSSE